MCACAHADVVVVVVWWWEGGVRGAVVHQPGPFFYPHSAHTCATTRTHTYKYTPREHAHFRPRLYPPTRVPTHPHYPFFSTLESVHPIPCSRPLVPAAPGPAAGRQPSGRNPILPGAKRVQHRPDALRARAQRCDEHHGIRCGFWDAIVSDTGHEHHGIGWVLWMPWHWVGA